MFAGQLADRVMSSEYLMALFHLVGAGLLFLMARIHDYNTLWWTAFAYALLYNPTIAISNSLAFHNVPDATRDFPTLRVLGDDRLDRRQHRRWTGSCRKGRRTRTSR